MGANDYARIKREIELKKLRTFARIKVAEDGGPIIDLITGREPHPVGIKCCIKADMRALQWESMRAELPMIEICEVASPVHSMMTQPHELFMNVTGERREWVYRPDMHLRVEASFAAMLQGGTPFHSAVAEWTAAKPVDHLVNLIVEVKHPDDPRFDDEYYDRKLELARQVYESINWQFIRVDHPAQVPGPRISRSVREIMLDHDTSLSPGDIDLARKALGPEGAASLREICEALGEGHFGVAKCSALHVRRIVSIDLRHDMAPHTPVRKLPDSMAIFEMEGRTLW